MLLKESMKVVVEHTCWEEKKLNYRKTESLEGVRGERKARLDHDSTWIKGG